MRKRSNEADHLPIEGHRGRRELEKLYAMTAKEIVVGVLKYTPKGDPPSVRAIKYAMRRMEPFLNSRIAHELRELYDQHKGGDKAAILHGLFLCIVNDLPIPRWCAEGFFTAIQDVVEYRAKSWDDVFGRPHPKGTHLEALRKRLEYVAEVRSRIRNLKETNPEIAIDAALFERVGKEFGIGGKTLTEEYYYGIERRPRKSSKNE
jgi:hypothetical protein